ncbi:MAG: HD domain-containing protein, partial [Polyangiaceae bacterium]
VKGGNGGLRDLDGVRWAARARYRVGEPGDPQNIWRELVRLGVFVGRESQELTDAETFLWRVRNRLHAHADRKSDRLTFDEQETIALEMGYVTGDSESDDARALGAERLMQDYYLHARTVTRARERMFERARPPRKRSRMADADLGQGVRLFDGHVTLAGSAELAQDPPLALRVYAACIRHDAPVLPFAREVIARATSDPGFAEALRASREANDLFADLICTVAESRMRSGSIAGELHDVGLLLAMIPEFLPVTGRVHHDTYHVYTVDVHSVAALDCLRSLARGELAHVHPLASRLAAEIARPRPLFLATLLHDVGKGYPDATGSRKNHSQSGAELCDRILPRLGLCEEDVAEARALVAQHLSMYHIATRRDLDDPNTIQDFCKDVRGREGLRDLYLLTVADITTTSPTAMTSWKSRMLEELYLASDRYLFGGRPSQIDVERLERVREAAAKLWIGPPSALDGFVRSMPERYLLANTPDAIVAHAKVALDRRASPVHAALVPSKHPEFSELCVIAEDRPGLLA